MSLIKANGLPVTTSDGYSDEGSSVTKRKFEPVELTSPNRIASRALRLSSYENRRIYVRLCIFVAVIIVIQLGKTTIPDVNVPSIVDKALDMLQGVNDWILANPFWRDTLLIICTLFMDGMFLSLGTYWIFRGKSSRLIVSMAIFYSVRAFIQSLFISPYTKGYWWEDPGFPSIIVPYGRGSDFFFSGHIGFVTICVCEWQVYGKKAMVWIISLGGVYTGFILMAYQVHYCIDVFTGVLFAHWTFWMVDHYKEKFDNAFLQIYWAMESMVSRITGEKMDEKLAE